MSTSPAHSAPACPAPFGEAELRRAAEELWEAVSRGDEHAAYGVVLGAHDAGADDESLLLDVIGTVQRRVGEEWAANRISVATEHAATAVNDRMIAALAARHATAPTGRDTDQDRLRGSPSPVWTASGTRSPPGCSPRCCGYAAGRSTTSAPRCPPRT